MVVLDRLAVYAVRVNWTGAYEDVADLTIVPPTPGGSPIAIQRGRDQGRVLGGPMAATCDATLWNESRRFATPYSGSDLHNLLRPGRPYQVRMTFGSVVLMDDAFTLMDDPGALMAGYEDATIFTGFTSEQVESYQLGNRVVELPGLGALSKLVGQKISIDVQSPTTGEAMRQVFQAVGLPTDQYVLDPEAIANGRVLPFWWVDDRDAYDVARELWATEGPPAALYEDGEGRIRFEGRFYRSLNTRSSEVQQTFDTTTLPYVEVGFEVGWDKIVNDVSVPVEIRAAQAVQQVWQYSDVLVLAADEELTITARSDSDPWTSIQTPETEQTTTIAITGTPTGGDFTLTVTLPGGSPQTTGAIGFNAAALTVQSSLEALSNVAPGDVQVTGGPGPGTAWLATWGGAADNQFVTVSANGAGLTGGVSPAVVLTQGVTADSDYSVNPGGLVETSMVPAGPMAATITLIAGPQGAQINPTGDNAGFRLRAAPIASVTNTVARQTIDASGSIAAYGLRSLPSQTSIWPVLLEAEAAGLADAYVDAYQEPRPVFRLELLNATGALTREIAMREVSDLIHIVDPWSGIDHQVSVEQITHEIAGSIHRLTLLCEQFLAQDWAVWDSTALGDRWDAGTFGQ